MLELGMSACGVLHYCNQFWTLLSCQLKHSLLYLTYGSRIIYFYSNSNPDEKRKAHYTIFSSAPQMTSQLTIISSLISLHLFCPGVASVFSTVFFYALHKFRQNHVIEYGLVLFKIRFPAKRVNRFAKISHFSQKKNFVCSRKMRKFSRNFALTCFAKKCEKLTKIFAFFCESFRSLETLFKMHLKNKTI